MDFAEVDIHAFLKASMPLKFQDIGPFDFEKFIATLFRADGYTVQETEYTGDYGADLIITKDGVSTAVQVKRYAPGSLVTVGDVNQVIGACTYYKTQNALVITTSDFTAPAITLSKSGEVFLWNWPRLEKYISTVFLDNEDYHLYFNKSAQQDDVDLTETKMFGLSLLQIDHDHKLADERETIALHISLENQSERNLTVHVDLPLIISRKTKRQVTALQWKENYFFHGMLVSEATVELAAFFLKSQISEIKPGDRIILQVHIAGTPNPLIIDQKLNNPRGNCYIVTYCYGRESLEYHEMISFRDRVLSKYQTGRWAIDFYYRHGPEWITYMQKQSAIALVIRKLIHALLDSCLCLIRLFQR